MSFYDEIMEGLEEALSFTEGGGQARSQILSLDDNTISSLEESEEEDPLPLNFRPRQRRHPGLPFYRRKRARAMAQIVIASAADGSLSRPGQRRRYASKAGLASPRKINRYKNTLAKNKGQS